jgi:hypothetical protein
MYYSINSHTHSQKTEESVMRKLFSVLSLVVLFCTLSFGQAAVNVVLSGTDGTTTIPLAVGLDVTATDCIDPALGESDLPPFPPAGVFEIRFDLNPYGCPNLSTYYDYRNAPSFPFTGTKQHTLWWQTSSAGLPINITYELPTGATMTITDQIGGTFLNIGPFSGTGTATIPGSYTGIFTKAYLNMNYTNVGPTGPAPQFAIAPPSLNFGPVGVGLSSTLQATVSNAGTDPLTISNITSSDPQFTFTPNTFPITVAAGGTQVFSVTFLPTSLGTKTATLSFTHDGTNATSPFSYNVQGVGADAGPTFGVTPTSLSFGTVFVGSTSTRQLTVRNDGLSNTMNITSVTTTNADYSVTPTTATIAPGGNQVFDVTFAPSIDGTIAGDVVFTHNGTTSPDAVPVTGVGFTPPAVNGLVFEHDTAKVLEADFYAEKMQLVGTAPGVKIQAMQFRLLTNMAVDDETILTFQNIQKGSDVSDPSWVLDYNLVRGSINANGASEDTIYVILYNLQQDNGLPTGVDYLNLLTVHYRVADLPALVDYAKSSILIRFAEASTFDGNPVNITPSPTRDQLVVWAKNRVGSWGDVNGDGCLDILDLIMVVDHIVSRDSLTTEEFARADIAPWVPGNQLPDPDGFVNVQDLAVIQNTILTGFFPSGDPVGPCGPGLAKLDGDPDATVNIYINSEGISTYLESKVGIRGAQIEFGHMTDNVDKLVINTPLGQGYFNRVDDILKTLMYDRLGQKYIDEGNHFMADMPVVLSNPDAITLEKLILVDINQHKVMNIEINIIHGTTPLPLDYILFQNYPNPFNPSTSVKFQVPKTSDVTIKIYDMLGQEVRTLFTGQVLRGTYTTEWDGMNDAGVKMSSGSYIYRMTAGEFVQSKKMILLK